MGSASAFRVEEEEEGWGGGTLGIMTFVFPLRVMKPNLPGDGFLVLLFLCAQHLLSLFNRLYLNPEFFHISFFESLPDAAGKVETEWLNVA